MLCQGNSFATTVMGVACVFISILPINNTDRLDRQIADGSTPGGTKSANRAELRESGQNTADVTRNVTTSDQRTANPSGKLVRVKAMRMSALWPKSEKGYPVISYYAGGAVLPNMSHVDLILNYISEKTCIKFDGMPPKSDCFSSVTRPTLCAAADLPGDACFSDEVGHEFPDEPQLLHMPVGRCPFHEGVQSVARLLGLLPEHRRSDRGDTLKVMVTAAGTERLLFAQGQTSHCSDYEDDTPLDLFSVSSFDTSASALRVGAPDGIRSIEHGMVVRVRNIRHQWILDYKQQRGLGLSFYDWRDLVRAYGCEDVWNCGGNTACSSGGFRDQHCRCVCPLGFGGETCSERTVSEDEDLLGSNCSTVLRSQAAFTLADIGLEHDGSRFYACDVTVMPPGCMRALVEVNTSSLRPLKSETNPDFRDNNWCELYFTLLLKHSAAGWRTFCLDYFFNEETLVFMSHTSIDQTYGYMKMHVPRRETFSMIADIFFNITFVEVPECSKKPAPERGGAMIKIHSYTVMTAVFCYFAGVMLGVVGWIVMKGLCMTSQEEFPSPGDSPASSGSSSHDSLAPPTPAPPGTRPQPPGPEERPAPGSRPRPPSQLPPIAGQGQRLSSRQGGLRASFAQWGGAALSNLRAPFSGAGRASQGEARSASRSEARPPQQGRHRPSSRSGSRPSQPDKYRHSSQSGSRQTPQDGSKRRPSQGGWRPPAQGASRPPSRGGSRPPKYKTAPSRAGARRAPP